MRPAPMRVRPSPRTIRRQSITAKLGDASGTVSASARSAPCRMSRRRPAWKQTSTHRYRWSVLMAPAIRFRHVVALLGRFPALAGVDLDVDEGEVVLLQGPNGAGKTSLLRACAGLLSVVDGEAEVLGHDLRQDRRTVRRDVGLLGHASFLYDDLTVIDNVRFAVRASRAGTDAVDPALARLGLEGRLRDVAVTKLSAGQRRRAALAVLVARRPRLWLLD